MRRHWLKSGPDPRRREPVGLHAIAVETNLAGLQLPPQSVVKKLGAIKVQELDGGRVELGSLWTERPAALPRHCTVRVAL